jgi:hypothetical protein
MIKSAGDMVTQVNVAEVRRTRALCVAAVTVAQRCRSCKRGARPACPCRQLLYRINKPDFLKGDSRPLAAAVVGCGSFGPQKDAFYDLLCKRPAPKGEALYETLRAIITDMNLRLPGAERKCVAPSAPPSHRCTLAPP